MDLRPKLSFLLWRASALDSTLASSLDFPLSQSRRKRGSCDPAEKPETRHQNDNREEKGKSTSRQHVTVLICHRLSNIDVNQMCILLKDFKKIKR